MQAYDMNTRDPSSSPSREADTGPGWSAKHQFARLLELYEAQIGAAMRDAESAVDALVRSFTQVSDIARSLREATQVDSASAALQHPLIPADPQTLNQQLESMGRQMNAAVVAFQFHDKLTQRLDHVRYSLLSLASFVDNNTQHPQREQWEQLLVTMRQLYRTEEERQIFRHMIEEGWPSAEGHSAATRVCALQILEPHDRNGKCGAEPGMTAFAAVGPAIAPPARAALPEENIVAPTVSGPLPGETVDATAYGDIELF